MPRLVLALIAAVALAGCGDDETVSTPSPTPEATAVITETPTPSSTPTGTPTPTATEQPAPEEQEGGAGDEEEARVPVRFVVGPDGVAPPRVAIPAFLPIELIVVNRLDRQVLVRLEDEQPFPVAAGETVNARISGRRQGRYALDFGSAGEALLVTGAEVGP